MESKAYVAVKVPCDCVLLANRGVALVGTASLCGPRASFLHEGREGETNPRGELCFEIGEGSTQHQLRTEFAVEDRFAKQIIIAVGVIIVLFRRMRSWAFDAP